MQIKRTRLEIIDTEKRYNSVNQTENGSNSFWIILLVLFIIFILLILLTFYYRYIYRQIIGIFKRFTRRDKDSSSIIKEIKSDSGIKQRVLGPNLRNFPKFNMKYGSQRNKQYENKSKLKTLLQVLTQEKKKLLTPYENKIVASTNNIDLKKQLSLKMSLSSFSSAHNKYRDIPKSIAKKWDTKNLENDKCNELSAQNIKSVYKNSYQNGKDISFSDTDLKFLVIPLSSKKSNTINDEQLLLCKWNSGNINSKRRNSTSSKLIELKFENTDSFSDNTPKYEISTSKSNCLSYSLLSKNLPTDSKYFSDFAASKSDTLPNILINKLKRSTNSYTSFTLSSVSNTAKTENDQILNVNPKTGNASTCTVDKINTVKTNKLNMKPQINLSECNTFKRKIQKKIKSSVNMVKGDIKEDKNFSKTFKSDENFINTLSMKNNCFKNVTTEQTLISTSKTLVRNNDNTFVLPNHKTEINEIYDELGMLFSQYIKLQTRPCQRNYCPLKRCLKRVQHTTRKCQRRFNYYSIYPYDQRPMCNSGNICADTYDELKLMCTSSTERKGIYQCMFKRRKHFLHQPCILSN